MIKNTSTFQTVGKTICVFLLGFFLLGITLSPTITLAQNSNTPATGTLLPPPTNTTGPATLPVNAGGGANAGVTVLSGAASTATVRPSTDKYGPSCSGTTCKFIFLAPLPLEGISGTGEFNLGGEGATTYVKGLYIFGVAIAAGLAVIMIVIGGIEMSTVDAMSGKIDGGGRKKINAALSGLALALLSYLILSTINVNLLSSNFVPGQITNIDTGIGQGDGGNIVVIPGPSGNSNPTGNLYDQNNPNYAGTGPIAQRFPNAEWETHARQLITQSNLPNTRPSDIASFFPDGQPSVDNWMKLLTAMITKESGFRPGLTYTESFNDSSGNRVISTGLLQLSQESARGYGFSGITTEALKDPFKNLEVGIHILSHWVTRDGCIACGTQSGGGRYWSVLRPSGKLSEVKSMTNSM